VAPPSSNRPTTTAYMGHRYNIIESLVKIFYILSYKYPTLSYFTIEMADWLCEELPEVKLSKNKKYTNIIGLF
jgi:hypothetical protein